MSDIITKISEAVFSELKNDEYAHLQHEGERSHFVRFNQGKVRQATDVQQDMVDIRYAWDQKSLSACVPLTGNIDHDRDHCLRTLKTLRSRCAYVPSDPLLALPTQVEEHVDKKECSNDPHAIVRDICEQSQDLDLAGLFTGGQVQRSFFNSIGTKQHFLTDLTQFDASIFDDAGRAAKLSFGTSQSWQPETLTQALDGARENLAHLSKQPKTLEPDTYRAYLAPSALTEIVDLLSWKGFGLSALKSKGSPLTSAFEGNRAFHPSIQFQEQQDLGVAPGFNSWGFAKPKTISLIKEGRFDQPLISPRSGKEFDQPHNGSEDWEGPSSLEMGSGNLAQDQVLKKLGTGLYLNNLWYLNFSDLQAFEITGMTRFAAFWVENGEIVGPIEKARFCDSVYAMLGDAMIDLTQDRSLILNTSTYGKRQLGGSLLPGVLTDHFQIVQ